MPNSQVDVTAGAPNLESYINNGNGTVTDKLTGLIWQQTPSPSMYTHSNAVAYCASLSLGGPNAWRMPSLIELFSIVDTGANSPSFNATFFSGPLNSYWTTTPWAALPSATAGAAWVLSFTDGSGFGDYGVDNTFLVRCVR